MKDNFKKYIKAVGTGAKHNHDLEYEDMKNAMTMILDKEATIEQISGFLLGWRLKPETNEEFRATLDVFEKYVKKTTIDNSVELGYPFDGKKNNPYLFSLIAKQLKNYDVNIVVTGDELQPSKEGLTLKEIANKIEIPDNLYFFDRKEIFKELSDLSTLSMNLGLRTGLNTVERLINPGNSKYAFTGVFHKPFMNKYAEMFSSRYEKLVIVKGNEGTQEIYSKCQYWVIQNDNINEYKIDPKDFGINYTKSWEAITLEESIDIINNPSQELQKIVNLNCALILFIMNKASSVEEAYEMLNN